MELTILYDHWQNLEQGERSNIEFYKMVRACEGVLWAQNQDYVKSMQEVLAESDLEKEASLINTVIKDSVDSAQRTLQDMRDAVVDITQQTLVSAEEKVVEEFKETLGSLAEEASSELVQQELEAMSKAVTQTAEAVMSRVSSLGLQFIGQSSLKFST